MAVLKQVGSTYSSKPGYYYGSSIDFYDGYPDLLFGVASTSAYSDFKFMMFDTKDSTVASLTALGHHTRPSTDAKTGAVFDFTFASFELSDSIHGLFFTVPTSANYDSNDKTSLKFQEYNNAGTKIGGLKTLELNGTAGVKDLYSVTESSGADFGHSFVVTYSTYDPKSGRAEIDYERFSDAGKALGGGVLRQFNDNRHHGITFGTYFSSTNPNSGGKASFILMNRAAVNEKTQVELLSSDMGKVLKTTTFTNTGPKGQASVALDHYSYLRPGTTPATDFTVFYQTFRYLDFSGVSHEEVEFEKVDAKTLAVQSETTFDVHNTDTSVGLQHLDNGNVLALYTDSGKSYVKEFDANLHQVGAAYAIPHDNYGWDNFVSLGNDKFAIFWRQSTSAGTLIQHHALFQA